MPVLNYLNLIFIVVFVLAAITTPIWNKLEGQEQKNKKDNKSTIESPEKKSTKLEAGVNVILLLSMVLLFVAGFFWLLKSLNKYKWIFILLSIPVYIEYLTGTCIAIGTLSNVVKYNEPGRLSNQERTSIQLIAYVIFFLGMVNPYERLLKYAGEITSSVVSDVLTVLILLVFSFLYTFLTIALISTPISCGVYLLKIIRKHFPFKEQIKRYGDYFVKCIDAKIQNELYLICAIRCIHGIECRAKILLYLLLPLVYLIDIIKMCIKTLLSMIQSTIGFIVVFFRIIKKAAKEMFLWFLKLSDKHIVAVSFRLALIFSLVSIVILNRYQPFFKEYEASTTVFEFLASSIIIPVVFEWIYSIRNTSGA